ncbi:hypothetical protein EUX98_g220 [Antrodiella citrinella]|uniref:Uncharacterized protein n=1 Tax=Antrodiella citrinella TaxID=2447956 RepID=A0A4S4N4H2_9APHY|nr:hypothetical protein EUX98_g220 [Antrodiella citrinella]
MHRALTHGSARALVQPPTRFRAISYRDPTTAATLPVASDDLTCVDWQRVALQESMRVVEWIRYMHQHEHKAVLKLLEALRPAINYGEQRTPQWRNLAITGLPVVLVEILTEDGMFSTTPGAFKDIKYSIAIMSMLALCFRIVVTFDAPQDPNDGDWIFGCLQKRDQLFHTLWNVHYLCRTRRSTIPPDVGMPDLLEHFPFPAHIVVSHMVLLSTETSQRIPLSAHAAHFLLYYWVYTPDASERTSVISQVYAMMKKDMAESIPVFVQQFIAACTAEKSNHLIRFLNEIVPYARGHRTAGGGSAYQYLYVLTALLRYGAETFARIAVSPDYKSVELTQFLIVQCHWQLCCKEGSRDNAEAWKLIFGMLECIE